MSILLTGSSWFIGFHTAKKLLEQGEEVIGFDNENDYYDVHLKLARRKQLESFSGFTFHKGSLENLQELAPIFSQHTITTIIHLAAQAGVRYSITNPDVYIQSNLIGFYNILELTRKNNIKKLIYASSSSVYGNNQKQPFSVEDKVDHPISLYAATKKSNELLAYSYSHLFGISTIGLRFFTVYWPWNRPDMAPFIFTDKILKGEKIDVFNYGEMQRDFTYIDDIVAGIVKCIPLEVSYEIFNLWNDNPIKLEYFISLIEKYVWKTANKNYLPLQAGDVLSTYADITHTKEILQRQPTYSIEEWLKNLIQRYKEFYLH